MLDDIATQAAAWREAFRGLPHNTRRDRQALARVEVALVATVAALDVYADSAGSLR
jgi:hypothetical protein